MEPLLRSDPSANDAINICVLTDEETELVSDLRKLDITLMCILGFHWAVNILMMVFWRRLP